MNEQERLRQVIDILADNADGMCYANCKDEFFLETDMDGVQTVAKEITAIFEQPHKGTRSKLECALDFEFEHMGVKPRMYHFTKRAILRGAFKAISVAQVELRGQEGRGRHIRDYGAISTCIEKNTRLKIIEQATHLIEEFNKMDVYGIAICDRRDHFNKRYGRMKAKGRLLQHLLKEAQKK